MGRMRQTWLAAFAILWAGPALAVCQDTISIKDGPGNPKILCIGDVGSNFGAQTQLIDGSGNINGMTANALDVNIKSGGTVAIGSTTSTTGGSLILGGVTTLAPTTYTNLGNYPLSLDTAGNLRTSLLTALPAGTNVIGHTIIDTGSTTAVTALPALPAGTNVIGHVIVDTTSTTAVTQATAANLNATVVGTAGAALATSANQTSSLGTVAPGTAPGSMQVGGAVYNVTAPTPADTQSLALQADVEGRLKVASQPALTNMVTGTASTTTTTTTSLVALVATKRLYITSFSCDNTGASTSKILFQDGSGGTTIWTTLVPAGGASNQGTGTPMFRTTAGNALFFAAQTASTTIQCSAAGFSGA
jgi:hypothetical protein